MPHYILDAAHQEGLMATGKPENDVSVRIPGGALADQGPRTELAQEAAKAAVVKAVADFLATQGDVETLRGFNLDFRLYW
jgi:hypothetical protein